jgi:hypothetical protein
MVPITITSTANAIKNHKDQPLEVAAGEVATAAGVLTGSADVPTVAADVVATAAGVLTVSEDGLAAAVGVALAAGRGADFWGCAGSRVG